MQWTTVAVDSGNPRAARYQLTSGDGLMTWRDVLHAWSESEPFADYYSNLLATSPIAAFRWETPRLDESTLDTAFEFVLVQSNELLGRTDPADFEEHFRSHDLVVTFTNLGGDAVLVVPRPMTESDEFGHFADFLRSGSQEQIRCLWRETSAAVSDRVRLGPLWLSTAGGGVPWLHIRLDDRPKYYSYAPYRTG